MKLVTNDGLSIMSLFLILICCHPLWVNLKFYLYKLYISIFISIQFFHDVSNNKKNKDELRIQQCAGIIANRATTILNLQALSLLSTPSRS